MNRTQMTLDSAAEPAALLPIDNLPLPYFEVDARGIVIRANRAALAMHPPEQGEFIGQSAFSFLAGCDREPSIQSFAAMLESPDLEPQIVVRYLYDRSRKYSAYQLHRTVMRDAAGNPTGMRIAAVNVSEATEAREESRRRGLWMESILDSMHEAIIATDATGVIMGVNPAAEELLGWKASDLVGKMFEEGIQMRSFQAGDKSQITFAMGLAGKCNGLGTLVDCQGREVIVRVWSSPLLDKQNGSVAGIVLMMYKPGAPLAVSG